MSTSKRNGVIDLMRLAFCLIIVLHHSRNLGSPEHALFARAGYLGVEFFFIVSGFLMAKSALTMPNTGKSLGVETVQFLWRKIRAILPYFLFAVLFSYGSKALLNHYSFTVTIRNFLLGIWDLFFLNAAGLNSFRLIRATWYLSAMYLGMFILFPMLRKWRSTFTHILAPLLAIFLTAYLFQAQGNLNQYTNDWNLVYPGVIRAVAELSLGCTCYVVCEKLQNISYTSFSRTLITLVQIIGYGFVFYCMHDMPSVKYFEFVLIPLIAVCVVLSFSGRGMTIPLFSGKLFPWLGKMSMIIYLNHMWVKDAIAALLPESLGYWNLLCICLCCVFAVSLCCLLVMDGISSACNKHKDQIRRLFIKA